MELSQINYKKVAQLLDVASWLLHYCLTIKRLPVAAITTTSLRFALALAHCCCVSSLHPPSVCPESRVRVTPKGSHGAVYVCLWAPQCRV